MSAAKSNDHVLTIDKGMRLCDGLSFDSNAILASDLPFERAEKRLLRQNNSCSHMNRKDQSAGNENGTHRKAKQMILAVFMVLM